MLQEMFGSLIVLQLKSVLLQLRLLYNILSLKSFVIRKIIVIRMSEGDSIFFFSSCVTNRATYVLTWSPGLIRAKESWSCYVIPPWTTVSFKQVQRSAEPTRSAVPVCLFAVCQCQRAVAALCSAGSRSQVSSGRLIPAHTDTAWCLIHSVFHVFPF